MAFPFVSLKEHNDLGIFIFDENKSHLDIEKGFFVDSRKSYAVQLVDLAPYYVRKMEEDRIGKPVNQYHRQTFSSISRMVISLDSYAKSGKILDWVSVEAKK